MRRGRLAVGAAIFLLARGSAEAMPICQPQPDGIDPAYGNFTPTNWVEGNLCWMNNAVGASFFGLWVNTDFDMWFVGFVTYQGAPIAAHFDGFSVRPIQVPGTGRLYAVSRSRSLVVDSCTLSVHRGHAGTALPSI